MPGEDDLRARIESLERELEDLKHIVDGEPAVPRRTVIRSGAAILGTAALAGSASPVAAQEQTEPQGVRAVPLWYGATADRPAPAELDNKRGVILHLDESNGRLSRLDLPGGAWSVIHPEQEVRVQSVDDLPAVSGGNHQLESNTVYTFIGEIESDAGLEVNSGTVLRGRHRELDWFIHTGSGTAIFGRDADFTMSNMGINAPGGTIFDLEGTGSSEFLVESAYFADDQELGRIADLGRIGTFRSPQIDLAGFRDFDAGLTFDGTVGRASIIGSTVRDVDVAGVTVFTFSSTFQCDTVDVFGSFFRDLQSDTAIVDVDSAATIDDVFQYQGNSHDGTVTRSNILVGAATPLEEPYWVSDSHPLRESNVVGELSLDSETETTISAQNTWTDVAGVTSPGNEIERMSESADGVLQYDGTKDTNVHITASVSFYGSNGDIYKFGIDKNDTIEPSTAIEVEGRGQNANVVVSTSAIEDLETNDTMKLVVQNTSGTNNLTVSSYTLNCLGS